MNMSDFDVLYERSVDLYNLGDYEASLVIALRALKLQPERPKIYRLIAYCYKFMGQLDRAINNFKKVLLRAPRSEDASEGLYLTFTDMGCHKEAMAEITRFLSIAESEFYRYLLVGIIRELKWAEGEEDKLFDEWKAEMRSGNTDNWNRLMEKIANISERKKRPRSN